MDNLSSKEQNRNGNSFARISSEIKICQYLPLECFLDDLENGYLLFSRKRSFIDSSEGSFELSTLFIPTAIGHNIPPQEINQIELQERLTTFRQYKDSGNLYASCWTLREDENYLMWIAYAKKYGVRIMTTTYQFLKSFKSNKFDIFSGQMSYNKHDIKKSLEYNLFTKDTYYSDEKEFRFYILPKDDIDETKSNDRMFIQIDWRELNLNVVISPFYNQKCAKCIIEELKEKYTFLNLINESKMRLNL